MRLRIVRGWNVGTDRLPQGDSWESVKEAELASLDDRSWRQPLGP
ncbi:hypothetical protein [Rosistilla oblonga]|nr:hypothetical protein [Rosistilla oblonga]